MAKAVILSIAVALSTPALAQAAGEMPRLDVTQTCRSATSLQVPYGESFAACMRDEADARDEVAKNWSSYSAAVRSRCSAETMIAGSPSYVELATCLDIDRRLSHEPAKGTEE